MKKILLIFAIFMLIPFLGFSEFDSTNQIINLEGSVGESPIKGITFEGHSGSQNAVTGGTLSGLDLTEDGEATFTLKNKDDVRIGNPVSYTVEILATPFRTEAGDEECFNKLSLILSSLTPSSNVGSATNLENMYSVDILETSSGSVATIEVNYLGGVTPKDALFCAFTLQWDGCTTLKAGDYVSTVTTLYDMP